MDYIRLKDIKDAYIDKLISQDKIDKAMRIYNKENNVPVFNGFNVHPETEPNKEIINEVIEDISIDILGLNKEISAIGNQYNDLMNEVAHRLKVIEELLQAEENRIKDMNIICGNYDEFVTVKTLNYKYFTGMFGYDSNYVFFAYPNTAKASSEDILILDISGNGYEGNKYVYQDDEFVQDSLDTSNRNYLIDEHISTYYEYSRLTSNTELNKYPQDVNFDNIEAQCTITCVSQKAFGTMKISSDFDNIIIQDILYSTDDGNTYISCLDNPININNLFGIYNDGNYIYGSGIICFPSTNYLKIVLSSTKASETDKIAFTSLDTIDATNPIETIILLDEVKRHVIRINDLSILSGTYRTGTKMQSEELISEPIESIAIFASEYVPSHFPDNQEYIQYVLTVNGIDYNIVPINSNKEGIKVIRSSKLVSLDTYAEHINESIKSASLSIIINTPDSYTTPYVSNVKICYGKAVSKE